MIFVTGGTGILGARLIYDLLERGEEVRALKRKDSDIASLISVLDFYSEGHGEELCDKIEWVVGDILDITLLESSVGGCSACFHSAALVSFHPRDQELMRTVNIEGTANVVNACSVSKVPLVYVSSVAALGRTSSDQSLDESNVWKDSPYNSGYAISKYHAEMEVWRGIEEGLEAVIINPTIILGAGVESRSSGTIFGAVNEGLKFYTDGGASVVDVRDVSAIAVDLWKKNEFYSQRFVLNSASIPYRSLFNEIADSLSTPRPSIHIGNRLLSIAWRVVWLKDLLFRTKSSLTKESARSSISSYEYSSAKVRSALDFEFRDWQESVRHFAKFYS